VTSSWCSRHVCWACCNVSDPIQPRALISAAWALLLKASVAGRMRSLGHLRMPVNAQVPSCTLAAQNIKTVWADALPLCKAMNIRISRISRNLASSHEKSTHKHAAQTSIIRTLISFITSISRSRSATSFFGRAFSVSSCFTTLIAIPRRDSESTYRWIWMSAEGPALSRSYAIAQPLPGHTS